MLQIAQVLKSHGTEGGLLLGFRGYVPEDIDTEEPVFIEFDGLPVPFFIQSLTPRGTDKAIVHLQDICSLRDAEEVVGRPVFVDYSFEEEDGEEDLSALVGWTVRGVGRITDFIDIAANPCLEVETKKGAVLLPLHEDLIVSMDLDRREIELVLPDGILDV